MHQVAAIQLAHMPLHLVCLSNGLIAFVKVANFSTIYEHSPSYDVYIDSDGLTFKGEGLASELHILYNEPCSWRDNDVLRDWLVSMELSNPFI